jgi:hypothetical protein
MRKRRCPTNEATLAAQWCSTATLSRCSVCVDAQNGFSESAIISREVSLALPKGKENLSAQLPRESDGGRAGGRTAEAPQYAAEACIKQKPPLTQGLSIPSFRFAASITALILIKRSDSSDGPSDMSQSAFNNSPNSMCCTTGF